MHKHNGQVHATLTELKNMIGDVLSAVDEYGEVLLTSYNKPKYRIEKIKPQVVETKQPEEAVALAAPITAAPVEQLGELSKTDTSTHALLPHEVAFAPHQFEETADTQAVEGEFVDVPAESGELTVTYTPADESVPPVSIQTTVEAEQPVTVTVAAEEFTPDPVTWAGSNDMPVLSPVNETRDWKAIWQQTQDSELYKRQANQESAWLTKVRNLFN
jgi:hypothetical protein